MSDPILSTATNPATSTRTAASIISDYSASVTPLENELKGYMDKGAAMTTADMLEVQRLLNQISQMTGLTVANLAKYFEVGDKVINKL